MYCKTVFEPDYIDKLSNFKTTELNIVSFILGTNVALNLEWLMYSC